MVGNENIHSKLHETSILEEEQAPMCRLVALVCVEEFGVSLCLRFHRSRVLIYHSRITEELVYRGLWEMLD